MHGGPGSRRRNRGHALRVGTRDHAGSDTSTYKPGDEVTGADMLSAAAYLAAGADKTSPITLDEVVNLNNYLGVNLWTYTRVRKVQTLTIKYFQFKDTAEASGWFTYDQGTDACKPGSFTPLLTGTI